MKNNVSTHPNPQFERGTWQSLNGEWDFGFKKAKSRYAFMRAEEILSFYKNAQTTQKINVPFCIESSLSGIEYKNFVNIVWYKKCINITKDERIFLHIGAADYKTTVLINGKIAGTHKGGYTSFSFEISNYVNNGENEIFIICEDDTKNPLIPTGKQSDRKNSYACSYTRTTGIWQNVYIEYVPKNYIESFKIYPDINQKNVTVEFALKGKESLECRAVYEGKIVGTASVNNASGNMLLQIPLDEIHLWQLGEGNIYDLEISFGNDKIKSYFGMRSIQLDGFRFLLNGKSVFQRLVLDQGYYKKGIYTAENDDELIRDIELSIALGFNGARLHQKVFDPRFLYFCDLKGYMVWGEYANWGIDYSNPKMLAIFIKEWTEALERDFNHPAIIGWCPFNETWDYRKRKQYNLLLSTVYDFTKMYDPTRPCIDTSGNFHTDKTDIYDVHDYRYDVDEFKASYDRLMTDNELYEHVLLDNPGRQKYNGEPVFVSEYGGIKWEADKEYKSWGYGADVATEDEFLARYKGLTAALLSNSKMLGFCYTQLYDVEQEQNGLYTYERNPKFSQAIYDKIKAINSEIAEIEKQQ